MALSCGSGGIRTPEPLRVSRFQGECIRPLCHASTAHRTRPRGPATVRATAPVSVRSRPGHILRPSDAPLAGRFTRPAESCGHRTRRRVRRRGARRAAGGTNAVRRERRSRHLEHRRSARRRWGRRRTARRAGRARRRWARHRRPDPLPADQLPRRRRHRRGCGGGEAGCRSPAAWIRSSRGRRPTPRRPRPRARPGRRPTPSSTARSSRSSTPSTATGPMRSPVPARPTSRRAPTSSPAA